MGLDRNSTYGYSLRMATANVEKGTVQGMRTYPPAYDYCNAIGPSCGQPPVAIVVTHDTGEKVNFSYLMCKDHTTEYFNNMIAGMTRIIAIQQLPTEAPRVLGKGW